jgi:3'-5' exonuclease
MSTQKKIIFDIETVGEDFDELDETTQESLTHWIEREAKDEAEYKRMVEDLKNRLGFSPLTGEIVALGVLDPDTDQGAVYFQAPGQSIKETAEGSVKIKQLTEKEILEQFWRLAESVSIFVTFNGRSFDVPFINIRSAIWGVRPTKDLMRGRYLYQQNPNAVHIDLQDQLAYYGAMWKKGSLHLWSRAFGIKSPKSDGVTGDDVGKLFKEKKFLDIARYNIGDLNATRDLFKKWSEFLQF